MANPAPSNQPDPSVWGWFARYPVLPFLLPLAVFMLVGGFQPSPPDPETGVEADNWFGLSFAHYPYAYAVSLLAGFAALAVCWRPIRSQFPLRVTAWSAVVGVLGVVLWVGICWLDLEGRLVEWIGEENPLIMLLGLGPRPAFNPFEDLPGHSAAAVWAFLAVRFLGLAVLVPISEELMLRGWLMRNLETDGYHPEFWQVAFGKASAMTLVVGTAFPLLYHPEKLASLVWFSLVSWLMVRTRNFWDCVVAHAVTNFLLGVWVVTTGDWRLW